MLFGELGGGAHLAAPQPLSAPGTAGLGRAVELPRWHRGTGCTRRVLHTLCLDSQERRASAWQPELISLRAPQSIPGGVRAALRGLRAPCFAMGAALGDSPQWAAAAIKPEQTEQRRLGWLGGGPGLHPSVRNILSLEFLVGTCWAWEDPVRGGFPCQSFLLRATRGAVWGPHPAASVCLAPHPCSPPVLVE